MTKNLDRRKTVKRCRNNPRQVRRRVRHGQNRVETPRAAVALDFAEFPCDRKTHLTPLQRLETEVAFRAFCGASFPSSCWGFKCLKYVAQARRAKFLGTRDHADTPSLVRVLGIIRVFTSTHISTRAGSACVHNLKHEKQTLKQKTSLALGGGGATNLGKCHDGRRKP